MGSAHSGMRDVDRRFLNDLAAKSADDERVRTLFLGGSHASGSADAHSDLDLYLITRDEDFESFRADRRRFLSSLGDTIFLEEHEQFGFLMLLYIFADGVHGEIAVAPARDLTTIHSGPYITLLDKDGLLEGRDFPAWGLEADERAVLVRRLLQWFWYDRRLLDVALARDQLWTAHYYLERCRTTCLDLARLRDHPEAHPSGYEKCERAVAGATLDALAATVVPLETERMRTAARLVTRLYLDVGRVVAERESVAFPERLATTLAGD
jgi:hypothetical protein